LTTYTLISVTNQYHQFSKLKQQMTDQYVNNWT